MAERFVLNAGESLKRGEPLTRGRARAWLQSDGNFVVTYDGRAIWQSATRGADLVTMQADGNLKLTAGGKLVWLSRTPGHPGALLDLQTDGNLVIYTGVGGKAVWASFARKGVDFRVPREGKSALAFVGRQIDHVTKGVTRTAKHVPGLGHAIRAGEKVLKGPIGDLVHKVLSNPVVDTVFGPVTVPANLAFGAATGGVKGATDAAKVELKNPVRRAATKLVGVIFPPAAPAAVALEAANRVLDALEKGDAVAAAKAAAQIGSAVALGEEGDAHAKEILGTLDKAREIRQQVSGVEVPMGELAHAWQTDSTSLGMITPAVHAAIAPKRFQSALTGLAKAAAGHATPAQVQKHADVVAAALDAGMHHNTPFFSLLGRVAHREVSALEGLAHGPTIVALVEGKLMTKTQNRTKALNRKVLAYNSKDNNERRAARNEVANLKARVRDGDHVSAQRLDELRRRTAALKKGREFTIDKSGMVRRNAH